jgi:hypothetical protein|tara:strand:+ start:377 stop:1078 length:702 start_codon:yes stop_codon:yes gene_type:complete
MGALSSPPIPNEKGQPSHTYGTTFFDGTYFTVNATPGSNTTTFRHVSGSSIKFQADGTISIIAAKQLFVKSKGNETNTVAFNGELKMEVRKDFGFTHQGKLADYQYSGTVKTSCKGENFTVDGTSLHKSTERTVDVTNTYTNKSRHHELNSQTYKSHQESYTLIQSDAGFGVKQTNPKNAINMESAGTMAVNVVKDYNTTVTKGKWTVDVLDNTGTINIKKNLRIKGEKIYLN